MSTQTQCHDLPGVTEKGECVREREREEIEKRDRRWSELKNEVDGKV